MKFDSLIDLKRNAHKIETVTLVKFEQTFPKRSLPHRYINEPRRVASSTGRILTLVDSEGSKSFLDWPAAAQVSLRDGEIEIADAGAILVYKFTMKGETNGG